MRFALLSALLVYIRAAGAADGSEVYYLVFLHPDPARQTLSKADAERIQNAHMANIHSMAERGILVAAGPFEDTPTTISGIFVFHAASAAEARRIAAQDPTVVEHRNNVDVHPWTGPAGIGAEYLSLHREHPETPEGMGIQPFAILLRGPAWDRSEGRASLLQAQADYLAALREANKLAAGGPVADDPEMVAVEVFKRIPLDEARHLLDDSPAVKAGVLRAEVHQWWCAEHVLPR